MTNHRQEEIDFFAIEDQARELRAEAVRYGWKVTRRWFSRRFAGLTGKAVPAA